jgi:hypothetical protein
VKGELKRLTLGLFTADLSGDANEKAAGGPTGEENTGECALPKGLDAEATGLENENGGFPAGLENVAGIC